MQKVVPEFGLYFYSWYSGKKWSEHAVRHTPVVGWYESANDAVIDWQTAMLASTGVDYIVFELVPTSDWCFSATMSTIAAMMPRLLELGIGYTFLLDVRIDQQKSYSDSFSDMLAEIDARGWLDKCKRDEFQKPILFGFSPDCAEAAKISSRYPDLRVYFPVWMPTWGTFQELDDWISEQNSSTLNHLFDVFFQGYRSERKTIRDILEDLNYVQFWQPTHQSLEVNGFASIAPGYDDLLMRRTPQLAPTVDRDDGKTLFSQFSRAVESGAGNILIYGWNEYFETTNIEPTLEYGDFYVQLTRTLIDQVKRGVPLSMPDSDRLSRSASIIYLTPSLKTASERHHDKVPRWDQDNYVASIAVSTPGVSDGEQIRFSGISVCNDGTKGWNIASANEPIRLGVRLYGADDQVIREGRGELSGVDVPPGAAVVVDVILDASGLSVGTYRVVIDVVWEHAFWFQSEVEQPVRLGEAG
ncbi:hypothetical protein AB3X94_09040 [Paraburkholderia sp. BR10923]|uniref:hypothetical protein n=1 Tax=Paraburkholderia sp. BR10923 TaxID=3236992 RepID=UPI0034CE6954